MKWKEKRESSLPSLAFNFFVSEFCFRIFLALLAKSVALNTKLSFRENAKNGFSHQPWLRPHTFPPTQLFEKYAQILSRTSSVSSFCASVTLSNFSFLESYFRPILLQTNPNTNSGPHLLSPKMVFFSLRPISRYSVLYWPLFVHLCIYFTLVP
jgi:hypothetical protein